LITQTKNYIKKLIPVKKNKIGLKAKELQSIIEKYKKSNGPGNDSTDPTDIISSNSPSDDDLPNETMKITKFLDNDVKIDSVTV